MNRREFVRRSGALGVLGLTAPTTAADRLERELRERTRGPRLGAGGRADLVVRGGVLFDGTGAPGREVDVAVVGDRIAEIGSALAPGSTELDIRGLALAPGFIDIHSHADLSLLVEPRAESRIRQGVTLEVVGQDGSSIGPWSDGVFENTRDSYRSRYGVDIDFRDVGGFLDRLDRTRVAVNLATMVGHGTVRGTVVGGADRPATEGEIGRMRGHVRDALAGGAVGLSSGLEYTPGSFAEAAELVALAAELAGTGLPYASHMRNEDDRMLAAVEETLHVGRMAGVPVQVSHLKAQGRRNYWKADAVLALIERARGSGLDVHFDRYPYVAYATGLSNLFPTWARAGGTEALLQRIDSPDTGPAIERFTRDKVALLGSWDAVQISSTSTGANASIRGRRLGEVAQERGEEPYALTVRLMRDENGGVGMIGFGMSEENTVKILAHPLGMVCSDGGAYAPYGPLSGGAPHPRSYGSFPRLLGHYVRDTGALSLESAINKITGLPAAKLGIVDRGVVRVGAFADLVAFAPSRVRDGATFADPHRYPVGIEHVWVNGELTIRDGEQTGALAGRPVRGPGATAR